MGREKVFAVVVVKLDDVVVDEDEGVVEGVGGDGVGLLDELTGPQLQLGTHPLRLGLGSQLRAQIIVLDHSIL